MLQGLPLEIREAATLQWVEKDQEDGSICKGLTAQAQGPELRSPGPVSEAKPRGVAWTPRTGKQIQAGPWGQRASEREHPIHKMEWAKALCMEA